ncbi:Aorsin, partial [Lachnellula willkommii]
MKMQSLIMKMRYFSLVVGVFVCVCEAAPTGVTYSLHEKRSALPKSWVRSNRVEGDSILPVRIGLTQTNLENGYGHLMDVSHPDSPNFGKHWTAEQVHEMFAPSKETVEMVREWLVSTGIEDESIVHSDNKGWIALNIPASQAEDLFKTEYHEHVHSTSGKVRIGSDEYYVPDHVRVHVDYISPGVKLSAPLKKNKVKRTESKVVHKPGPVKMDPPENPHPWQVLPAASGLPADLQDCGRNPQTVTLYQVDDDNEALQDGGFNVFLDALDGSYCNSTAYGITGDTPGIDPVYPDPAKGGYKGALNCGTFTPTRVISVSYGVSEYDAPVNYTKRQCDEFLKLGLQGHTFIWASGDYGVASFPGDDTDSGCLGHDQKVYNPSFPTCPYVTNVGATRLYDTQTVLDPESALQADLGPGAELFASAGGFANYFPVPDYQKTAVSDYFKNHDPGLPYYTANADATNIGAGGGVYNRAGRGFPDVSANGAQLRAFNNLTDGH